MDVDILTYDDLVLDGESVGGKKHHEYLLSSAPYTLMHPLVAPVSPTVKRSSSYSSGGDSCKENAPQCSGRYYRYTRALGFFPRLTRGSKS